MADPPGAGFSNHWRHVRRGEATPPFTTVAGSALEGNVLRGVITAESVELYVAESGVPLYEEQRQALVDVNCSFSALRCVTLLAGVGETALAHCLLKAFLEANHNVRPQHLALYCVPTRALREEVVLELIQSKALVWFLLVLVAVCLS